MSHTLALPAICDMRVGVCVKQVTAMLGAVRYSGALEHLPELAVPGSPLVWVSVMLSSCTVLKFQ